MRPKICYNIDMIYLDHAAATPVSEKAKKAMEPYFSERFFNPSAAYQASVDVRRDYEAAKDLISTPMAAPPAATSSQPSTASIPLSRPCPSTSARVIRISS
jgi:cysteine desulfurase